MNIEKEVAAMKRMTVAELREKYRVAFDETTTTRNKQWLIKRIAYRLQANAEGDLSERARKRALEIANDADLRMMPPRPSKSKANRVERTVTVAVDSHASRDLPVGTQLKRNYKGQNIVVLVTPQGFEFEGEKFKSLSGVAKAATGKHWNGYHFFRVGKPGGKA